MKYYQGVDYFLFFMDFPHMGVPGVIASNSDGTANIYINTLYCEQVQSRTIKHELRHLVKNHFYIDWMSIEEKELEADDIDDPSCVFSDDFSCVEYVEYHKPKLPNVFKHGSKSIQEVEAGRIFYNCHVGVVITNRYFTRGAKELAQRTGTLLWDRDFIASSI